MISLLIVNYRSAALAIEAIRTARVATTEEMQVVVVDNSCDANEADALRAHVDELIVSGTNRGYAGAINDGRRACEGAVLIVSNPDVKFGAGSIDTLASALTGNVAVAGPALFWDDAMRWMLPPSELHTAGEKFGEVLASRSRVYAKSRDRARIRHRIAFWSSTTKRDCNAISGAIMAIDSEAFDELGGFDERFTLYFEENDFLRRVAERRRRITYVPTARCRHIYNQSAAQSERAATQYADSEMRYLEKWNGPFLAHALKRLERERKPLVEPSSAPITIERDDVLVEASPLPTFETAAGCFSNEVVIPEDVRSSYRGGVLYLRAIERDTARILATYKMML
jgi:GT2 family glycosyltransferase